jgi:hypothetical protein
MAKQKDFFEKKSVIATFGILALLGGIYFAWPLIGGQTVTGNVIVPQEKSIISVVPTIGLVLLICSAILIVYAIVKKE